MTGREGKAPHVVPSQVLRGNRSLTPAWASGKSHRPQIYPGRGGPESSPQAWLLLLPGPPPLSICHLQQAQSKGVQVLVLARLPRWAAH